MHNIIEDDSPSLKWIFITLYLLQGEGRAAMCKAVCIIVKLADSNMIQKKLYCCIPVCRHKRDILTLKLTLVQGYIGSNYSSRIVSCYKNRPRLGHSFMIRGLVINFALLFICH